MNLLMRAAAGAVALVLVLAPAATAQPPPPLTCEACFVIDDAGRSLFARRARAPLPNASTTKMVTALLIVRDAALGERVTASEGAAATGGGGLDLAPGDVYTVEDLLFALLLSSSNDAAVALAEHVAGSEETFVAAMNAAVRDLGAHDTRFVTSHGLDRPGHVSTARDLARIAFALLDDPVLAGIVATTEATLAGPGGVGEQQGPVTVENRNVLLEGYPDAVGVKTGFTAAAGNVLVAAAARHGRVLVAVAMRSADAAVDAAALMDFGFARLARTVLLERARTLAVLAYPGGATPVISLRAVRGPSRPDEVRVSLGLREEIHSPVIAGDVLGRASVSDDGGRVGAAPLVAADTVQKPSVPWYVDVFVAIARAAAQAVGRLASS